MRALLVAVALALPPLLSQAQASAASASPSSPAKKELVAKLIALQQPGIEQLARNVVEAPARQLLAAGEPLLQTRVPADKREAAVKQVKEDVRKYVDENYPAVRERALRIAQSTLAPALEEKFSEDELRQIVAFLESPANKKLQQALPEINASLAQKLLAESRPQIEPKAKALEASMAKSLGLPPAGAPASAPARAPRPAAPAASKP